MFHPWGSEGFVKADVIKKPSQGVATDYLAAWP
jgi:hypothetical protein